MCIRDSNETNRARQYVHVVQLCNSLSPLPSLLLFTHMQQVMASMTQVLAQTVYDLDILDLPLERLELEDQHRLQQKTRLKTSGAQDHISSATPRVGSFTTINVVSNKRGFGTYTPPAKLPKKLEDGGRSVSSMGDVGSKRGKLTKSYTEESQDSPPLVPRSKVKRFSTPDHTHSARKSPPRPVPTIKEEGLGESPKTGSTVALIPRRTSSAAQWTSNGEDQLHVDSLEVRTVSSPGATSLPPEMLFNTVEENGESWEQPSTSSATPDDKSISADKKVAQTEVKDVGAVKENRVSPGGEMEGEESVIVNVHAKSTSPEPKEGGAEGVAPDTTLAKSRDGSKSLTVSRSSTSSGSSKQSFLEVGEGKEGGKGHSKGKEGSKWTDLFHWRSPSVRSKPSHGAKPPVAPGDLVFTNKGFAKPPEPNVQKYRTLLSRSDSDTSDLRSKAEAIKEAKSTRRFSDERVHCPAFVHRSLSESNIHALIRAEAMGTSPSSTKASDDSNLPRSHLLLRRVISSGPPQDRSGKESMHDKVLNDEFSASIIPHSHDGKLTQQKMTSPSRHLPLTRAKLLRSATLNEESIDETNKRVQPVGSDDVVSKSPPALVLSPTSPVPPTVLSPASSPQGVGWNPVVAAVIWCRMLRVLGNINDIQDPYIHAEAIDCLQETWRSLSSVSCACTRMYEAALSLS